METKHSSTSTQVELLVADNPNPAPHEHEYDPTVFVHTADGPVHAADDDPSTTHSFVSTHPPDGDDDREYPTEQTHPDAPLLVAVVSCTPHATQLPVPRLLLNVPNPHPTQSEDADADEDEEGVNPTSHVHASDEMLPGADDKLPLHDVHDEAPVVLENVPDGH